MINVLVLGAGGAAGINFARSLSHDGGFLVTGTDCSATHANLSHCPCLTVPRVDAADRGEHLDALIKEMRPDVVYAQADKEVGWLSQNRHLPGVMLPSADVLGLCSDKLTLNTVLRARRVPAPMSLQFERGTPIWLMTDGPTPVEHDRMWIRAKNGAGSKAALPVANREQADAWVRYWSESRGLSPDNFMLCEFLPGPEYAWQGVYRDGRLWASVVRERLEYVFAEQMPSGQSSTPSVARIVHMPAVNNVAEDAVAAVDPCPNGVYGVDCKTGADGIVKVTEINAGRFYTTSSFYAAAGCNLPALFCRLAMGESPEKPGRDPIAAGKTWIRSLDREPVLINA